MPVSLSDARELATDGAKRAGRVLSEDIQNVSEVEARRVHVHEYAFSGLDSLSRESEGNALKPLE